LAGLVFAGLGALAAILVRTGCEKPVAPQTAVPSGQSPNEHAEVALALPRESPVRRPVVLRGATGSDGGSADVIGSTDPASKDYDPITLMHVMNTTPRALLSQEPRDPAFADSREVALRDRITERLRHRSAADLKVDATCRTSSCEISVQGASGAEELNAALEALDLDMLADTAQVGPVKGTKRVSIVVLYSAALRDHAAYEQWLRRHQANDEPAPRP
jgi:hypothetical protein